MKKYFIFAFMIISFEMTLFSQTCLGIQIISKDRFSKEFVISKVFTGSVAEKVNLKSGDKIIAINDKMFTNLSDLQNYFNDRRFVYKFTVSRNGKVSDKIIRIKKDEKVFLGLLLVKKRSGILIKEIVPNSPAYNSDLKIGDIILKINNEKVFTPEDVSKIINKIGFGGKVKIQVKVGNILKNKEVILYRWIIPEQYNMNNGAEFLHDLKHIINMIEQVKTAN